KFKKGFGHCFSQVVPAYNVIVIDIDHFDGPGRTQKRGGLKCAACGRVTSALGACAHKVATDEGAREAVLLAKVYEPANDLRGARSVKSGQADVLTLAVGVGRSILSVARET